MNSNIRTRLAVSPTGYPHIGTIYQALFDYAFAKKNNGKFVVRIEDTDRNRFVEGAEEVVFQSLDWFGIIEDESARKKGDKGPYRQSDRIELYHKHAQELIDKGFAYYSYFPKKEAGHKKTYTKGEERSSSFKTEEDPPATIGEMIERGDWVIRMRVPKGEKIVFTDGIRGEIEFDASEVTEQVLIKSDGFPTYHLAAVVDDYYMGITHIIRAEEWLSSTPKHVLLYRYLGWEMPPVFHTATLRNPDKSKLSKRHGHTNVMWFREQGFLPSAILNFLALLGWSHPGEKEVFTLEEFVELFDLKDIRPVAPIFDLTKLRWMNQQYIQMSSEEELKKMIRAFSSAASELPDDILSQLIPLLKTRMETLLDFEKLAGIFLNRFGEAEFSESEKKLAQELVVELDGIPSWKHDKIFEVMKNLMESHKLRMPVFYKIFTGHERGLPLPQAIEIFGKAKTIKRLQGVLNDD
jgi:glutamyl-tRNA synthetase